MLIHLFNILSEQLLDMKGLRDFPTQIREKEGKNLCHSLKVAGMTFGVLILVLSTLVYFGINNNFVLIVQSVFGAIILFSLFLAFINIRSKFEPTFLIVATNTSVVDMDWGLFCANERVASAVFQQHRTLIADGLESGVLFFVDGWLEKEGEGTKCYELVQLFSFFIETSNDDSIVQSCLTLREHLSSEHGTQYRMFCRFHAFQTLSYYLNETIQRTNKTAIKTYGLEGDVYWVDRK